MTLYEITSDYLKLLEMAEDEEMDEQAFKDTMEAIQGEIEVKAEGYAKVIKQLEADSLALKHEEARLKARREKIDNSTSRIKGALESAMRATDKLKFKTDLFSFNIRKNPASLKLAENIDFDKIPAEYIVFSAPSIDKDAVKKAIKGGASYDWAHLEQSESLRIE